MKMLTLTAALVLGAGLATSAGADPGKDESGKGKWRGGYERSYPGYGYDRGERRERRAFKEEYDDGNCKYERKLEKSGEYKEEVKCRSVRPRRTSGAYGFRY